MHKICSVHKIEHGLQLMLGAPGKDPPLLLQKKKPGRRKRPDAVTAS